MRKLFVVTRAPRVHHTETASMEGGSPAVDLCDACVRRDVQAVRRMCESGRVDVNKRDPVQNYTPLMISASIGDMELVWLLLEAKADLSAQAGGHTALDLARARGHTDVLDLLGGHSPSATGPPPVPDISSSEEDEAPVETGHCIVLDHMVSLSQKDLLGFSWWRYEQCLARLAIVPISSVFVTPEPGRAALNIHGTIIKRLRAKEASSAAGIEEVMATVKSLQKRGPLQQAAGANAMITSTVSVKLHGEAHATAEAVALRVRDLQGQREAYEEQRDAFEGALGDQQTRGLAASKAIILLRREREAISLASKAPSPSRQIASLAPRSPARPAAGRGAPRLASSGVSAGRLSGFGGRR